MEKLQADLKMTWKGSRDLEFLTVAKKRHTSEMARNRKHCSTSSDLRRDAQSLYVEGLGRKWSVLGHWEEGLPIGIKNRRGLRKTGTEGHCSRGKSRHFSAGMLS